ncbi:hypothetical protein KI387_041564, partial [Taxus chinensis]
MYVCRLKLLLSLENFSDVQKLCEKVVSVVLREVGKTRVLETAKNSVGINDLVKDFEGSCLKNMERKENIIGIYGMGVSGKTTLARELFNRESSKYKASCFLFDVGEASVNIHLISLQCKLLKDLVNEDCTFHSIYEGSSYLRSRLRSVPFLKFLIFIDDIDHVDQLNAFLVKDIVQNNFGSLIIVTTHDKRVLIRTECGGFPLSLQVLGGHVFGSNSRRYWKLELDTVRKTPPHDIKQRFKISIDALDSEKKQIFMDIACFLVNKSSHMAIRIWERSGWSPEHTIQTLKDKCLIEVHVGRTYWHGSDSGNIPLLGMHDHIHDLGREMVDELSTPRRLWRPQYLRAQ